MRSARHAFREAAEVCLPRDVDVLLIVPPFSFLHNPALGVHLLQACARERGFAVGVLYANLVFAKASGVEIYNRIANSSPMWMAGERIFAHAAFGATATRMAETAAAGLNKFREAHDEEIDASCLAQLVEDARELCLAVGAAVVERGYRVVGASSTFQQTASSLGLLNEVKRRSGGRVLTVLGGANCEGPMGEGLAGLEDPPDYIFSGECETAFPDFLDAVIRRGRLPQPRVQKGAPCTGLDALPEPDFDEYFGQLKQLIPEWEDGLSWLPYESSRGCWWGVHHHCTFCGLNGETMTYRRKSPDRVLQGLAHQMRRHSVRRVFLTDNILPHDFLRILLPRMKEELPETEGLFAETKANLTLAQVGLLRAAGFTLFQPGIEALSSGLLRRMNKGVLARQNIALLRYARTVDLAVNWNLLCDFPGDEVADYQETLRLLPLLRHLRPPGMRPTIVTIDRFSPYYIRAAEYGVHNIRPAAGYAGWMPEEVDFEQAAHYFEADYVSAWRANPGFAAAVTAELEAWGLAWKNGSAPMLTVVPLTDETYLLVDTRGLPELPQFEFLTDQQARAVLVGGPLRRQPQHEWAVGRKLAVELDGWLVPLATSDYETLSGFENARVEKARAGDELPVLHATAIGQPIRLRS